MEKGGWHCPLIARLVASHKVVQAQKYNRSVLKTNISSNIYMTVANLFDCFWLLVSYCRSTNVAGVHTDS